ncbi:phosphatidylglycerol lysyltransferase domain-containing protein [Maridesulfovibrio sp.]|uniref:phosphatidylglycerol lysyltransferase domain-containing protein n=1 Tax=Maridesulfovibrio sp. TaxID=2795000 RepID=UPI0039EE4D17
MNLNVTTQLHFLNSGDHECIPTLLPYLKQLGNRCMSYSTMQPGLNHAILDNFGYISWLDISPLNIGKHAVVLSEPVAAPHNQLELITKLEEHCGKLTLVQIGPQLAETLFQEGYAVYQIGVETELDILNYSLEGKNKADLRRWRNKAFKSGVTVEEKLLSSTDWDEVENVSHDWLQGRGGKELSFLTRPLPKNDEEGVRFFWARQNGRLIGFSGFDPIHSNGKIIGYYHNFDRISSNAVNGTSPFILLEAMEKFRAEGIKILNLGLSPLSGMEKGYNLSGPLLKLAHSFYRYGEKVYPFKGNSRHKAKFCGKKERVYVASNAGWFKTMVSAAIACGLEV